MNKFQHSSYSWILKAHRAEATCCVEAGGWRVASDRLQPINLPPHMFVGAGCVGLPVALVKVCNMPDIGRGWWEGIWFPRQGTANRNAINRWRTSCLPPLFITCCADCQGASVQKLDMTGDEVHKRRTCPRSSSISCLAAVSGWLGAACGACRAR